MQRTITPIKTLTRRELAQLILRHPDLQPTLCCFVCETPNPPLFVYQGRLLCEHDLVLQKIGR